MNLQSNIAVSDIPENYDFELLSKFLKNCTYGKIEQLELHSLKEASLGMLFT